LVIQAIGGASASIAVENEKSTKKGSHILLGGIVFQMSLHVLLTSIHTFNSVSTVSILLYTTLALEFLARVLLRRPLRSRRAREATRSSPNSNSTAGNVIGTPSNEEKGEEINEQEDTEQVQIQTISWRKVKLVVFSLGFSTLCIFIRCVKFLTKDKI
jgi:RTA1 like protein